MEGSSSATTKLTKQQQSKVPREAPLCSVGTVVNGIIPFAIENLFSVMVDTIQAFGMGIDEQTSYDDWNIHVLIRSTNNIDIDTDDNYNDKWEKFSRSATPRPSKNNYFIKVPFYLQSYSIKIKVQIQHRQKLNYVSLFSNIFTIKIPSLLVQPKLEIGELIQCRVKNAAFVETGKIVQILENDESGFEYKIENRRKQIRKVNRNDIYQDAKRLDYLIDTCSLLDEKGMNIHRYNAECDLVLKCKDKKLRNYYWTLRNIIANIIPIEFKRDQRSRAAYIYNFEYIGGLLSEIITNYLYFDEINDSIINYKIRCFISSHEKRTIDGFNIGFMYVENQWQHQIDHVRAAIQHGNQYFPLQNSFGFSGWSCSLCRCSININDWMYHCIPPRSKVRDMEGDDYCLQCTYSMANGIAQFENSLAKVVHEYIDKHFTIDCIKEIVAFTVGSVLIC